MLFMNKMELVRIIKPELKKGVLLFTRITQPNNGDNICAIGLKSGKQLSEEGIEYHTKIKHPYIFFRAPYFNTDIDYSTIHNEIVSLYGILPPDTYAFIRVDPDKTYVYASELRSTFKALEIASYIFSGAKLYQELDLFVRGRTKITLAEYLNIIGENKIKEENPQVGKLLLYNLYNLKCDYFPNNIKKSDGYTYAPTFKNSEILVDTFIKPEWFVHCISDKKKDEDLFKPPKKIADGKSIKRNSRKKSINKPKKKIRSRKIYSKKKVNVKMKLRTKSSKIKSLKK